MTYSFFKLGALEGRKFGDAEAINARGQTVGVTVYEDNTGNLAFLWDWGSMTSVGTLGGPTSYAWDINDCGEIVGQSKTSANHTHGFLVKQGRMIDLGTLGGKSSAAYGINNCGETVGISSVGTNFLRGGLKALHWQDGEMIDLESLSGGPSAAWDINNSCQIVGYSTTTSGEMHACLWDGNKIIDLGTLGGTSSVASRINERGQIVGVIDPKKDEHAFLWQNGTMIDLGEGVASDVNDHGQIVGFYWAGDELWKTQHACLWQDGATTPEYLGVGGMNVDSAANGINNRGMIVGSIDTSENHPQVVLWTPLQWPILEEFLAFENQGSRWAKLTPPA
jgi:probable HAF family extracellular repeat protein